MRIIPSRPIHNIVIEEDEIAAFRTVVDVFLTSTQTFNSHPNAREHATRWSKQLISYYEGDVACIS